MSNRLKIIFVLVILLVIAGGIVFYYRGSNTPPEQASQTVSSANPFPGSTGTPTDNKTSVSEQLRQVFGLTNASGTSALANTPLTSGRLTRLSLDPVGGIGSLIGKSTSTILFIEQNTGHIQKVTGTDALSLTLLSNTTLPGAEILGWGNQNGPRFLAAFFKETGLEISSGKIQIIVGTSTNPGTTNLTPVSPDIYGVTIAPDQQNVFYLTKNDTGATGWTSDFDFSKRRAVFNSTFTDWQVSWPEQNTLAFQTKASALAPGFLYFLNPKSGTWQKIIGGKTGLTTLTSPDAKTVLYNDSGNSQGAKILDVKTGSSLALGLAAWPEKCVWTSDSLSIYCATPRNLPAGNYYPDAWYQGTISFNDQLWQINPKKGIVRLLLDPSKIGQSLAIDGYKLLLDRPLHHLFLINKKDNSLWTLSLDQSPPSISTTTPSR